MIKSDTAGLLAKVDPRLLSAPLALWCAREACVKTHALEVGWFGSALRVTSMTPVADRTPDAEMSFDVEVRFESRPPMSAHAWIANGAAFAISAR